MSKLKICLAVILPLLFAACAGPKPAARRGVSEDELNAVRSRADAAHQGLDAETKATHPDAGH
jgi:hypothetical protein